MLQNLPLEQRAAILPLTAEVPEHLIIPAVLNGSSPGHVYTDDPQQPAAALIDSAEGHYLIGLPTRPSFIGQVRDYFAATIFASGYLNLNLIAMLAWHPHLSELVPLHTLHAEPRRRYSCTALNPDLAQLPEGYQIVNIDADLLQRGDLQIPEHILGWIHNNWGTREAYLQRGFGCCILHQNEVVSWSLADCVVGERCEIGIHTAPHYRKRGLAVQTTAAAVRFALTHGINEVGWHCNDTNEGSWRTAERVGFQLVKHYTLHYTLIGSPSASE